MIAFLNWLDGVLWGVPLIALMILTGLYFTVRSGFFQFRHFGWIMKRTGGKLFQKEDKASEGKGMLSSFEAISTAIGGTVGFGNIAGVATAVAAGGPGAIMWMWLSSLLGMILKQVEVTLGCYYRHTNEKGEYYGGPTYYMEPTLTFKVSGLPCVVACSARTWFSPICRNVTFEKSAVASGVR